MNEYSRYSLIGFFAQEGATNLPRLSVFRRRLLWDLGVSYSMGTCECLPVMRLVRPLQGGIVGHLCFETIAIRWNVHITSSANVEAQMFDGNYGAHKWDSIQIHRAFSLHAAQRLLPNYIILVPPLGPSSKSPSRADICVHGSQRLLGFSLPDSGNLAINVPSIQSVILDDRPSCVRTNLPSMSHPMMIFFLFRIAETAQR